MAERRIQRTGKRGDSKKSETSQTKESRAVVKRRSRSEGPHGRRRMRNSMQEGTRQTGGRRPPPSRFSMFTEPLSDDEIAREMSRSESSDSDDSGDKQWTKNPLLVKKTKRVEKNSKQLNRKSVHNMENGFSHYDNVNKETNLRRPARSKSPQGVSSGKNREQYVYQEIGDIFGSSKGDNFGSVNPQKGKYQKLEERRRKRIDMTVTSDEECTPQTRISRLRQRAIQSSNLFSIKGTQEDKDDLPHISYYESIEQPDIPTEEFRQNFRTKSNGYHVDPNRGRPIEPRSQNMNLQFETGNKRIQTSNGRFYEEYTKQQGIAKTSQPVISSVSNDGHLHDDRYNTRGRLVELPQGGVVNYQSNKESKVNTSDLRKDVSNRGRDSLGDIRMRSFREVRSNNPPPLKKAVDKIELHRRSPNSDSSEDSLDELIESNIQYLESEIESGKIKRQSGHFVKHVPTSGAVQRKPIQLENKPKVLSSVQDEIRFRLNAPSGVTSQTARFQTDNLSQSDPNVTMVISREQVLKPTVSMTTSRDGPFTQRSDIKTMQSSTNVYPFGSQNTISKFEKPYAKVTYSPYVQRRSAELPEMEDLSKSDSQLNFPQTCEDNPILHSYGPRYTNTKQFKDNAVLQSSYISNFGMESLPQSLSLPSVEAGMFSDVEYDIEVSERVKKWEKLMKRKFNVNTADSERLLNTIQESETFTSDSSQQNTRDNMTNVHELPDQKVSTMSVTLTKSTSTLSQRSGTEPSVLAYAQPRVVASETNLHRIFRVVSDPESVDTGQSSFKSQVNEQLSSSGNIQKQKQKRLIGDENGRKKRSSHAHSMTSITVSENENASARLQTKPPVVIDSDSGVRKSWRTSRYEEELSELKEIVSDTFHDLKKRFDSDASESEVKRPPSPTRSIPKFVKEKWDKGPVFPQPYSVKDSMSPLKSPIPISPVVVRKNGPEVSYSITPTIQTTSISSATTMLSPQSSPTKKTFPPFNPQGYQTPPVSPNQVHQPSEEERAHLVNLLSGLESKVKEKDVWSPNMTSGKGLISIERVKARTLQTIPFSEDPVWKEIEEMTSFGHGALSSENFSAIDLDDLESLLQFATGTPEAFPPLQSESDGPNSSLMFNRKMSQNERTEPEIGRDIPKSRHTDLEQPVTETPKHKVFHTPSIQPLRLKVVHQQPQTAEKSSASALDEVLEDIRASLQRKPLSPKTKKTNASSESSPSMLSPQQLKSTVKKISDESLIKPKISLISRVTPQPCNEKIGDLRETTVTQNHDMTGQEKFEQQLKEAMQAPFIDPQYTQFPYLINGNYHLDPSILKERLLSTGLAADAADESITRQLNLSLPANQRALHLHPGTYQDISANLIQAMQRQQHTIDQSKPPDTTALDQSVDELKGLAKEVEFKLSQIKSKIVQADDDRLDSILLALRKFAPTAEQRYFDVKFSPIDTGRAKKSKLTDALTELERIYDSLDLEDESIMDGADRQDYLQNTSQSSSHTLTLGQNTDRPGRPVRMESRNNSKRSSDGRFEDIAEVERQTQGEFENITKSFQVLLEEVTKQCKTVANNAASYSMHANQVPSELLIRKETLQEPVKMKGQPKVTQSHLKNDYNNAVKILASVGVKNQADRMENQFGNQANERTQQPMTESALYVSLDRPAQSTLTSQATQSETTSQTAPAIDRAESRVITQFPTQLNQTRKRTEKQSNGSMKVHSQPKTNTQSAARKEPCSKSEPMKTVITDDPAVSGSVSAAKELKVDTSVQAKTNPLLQVTNKTSDPKPPSRGSGRFRRRGNLEHRKSMPADVLKRTIETQTVETQTKFSTIQDAFHSMTQSETTSVGEVSETSDSSPDVKAPRKRKISKGIASRIELLSSSEDERGRLSQLKRSQSAPDLTELLNDSNSKIKNLKVEKPSNRSSKGTGTTPRFVKKRNNESRSRLKSKPVLSKEEQCLDRGSDSMTSSITSEDIQSPKSNKPPLYPWKTFKSEKDSPKKLDRKLNFERDAGKLFRSTVDRVYMSDGEVPKPRRKSEGCDNEMDEREERPRSFHELVSLFESNPDKLKRMKTLRKCASVDSVVTETVLRKSFLSDPDLFQDGNKSDSGMVLTLELQVKS